MNLTTFIVFLFCVLLAVIVKKFVSGIFQIIFIIIIAVILFKFLLPLFI